MYSSTTVSSSGKLAGFYVSRLPKQLECWDIEMHLCNAPPCVMFSDR